ncbi:thioredoxin [Bdellovibrionota bacterium FG-1]
MAGDHTLSATDANFDSDVMKNPGVSLVDFWAEWCGPCRQLGPTLDAIAAEYTGRIKIFKMNVDENPETPTRFHVRGIPTVLLIKDGQLVDQLVGNHPRNVIIDAIQKHL